MLVLLLFCFVLTFIGLGVAFYAFIKLSPFIKEANELAERGYCMHDYPVKITINDDGSIKEVTQVGND